jgi:hypothetical protein
MSNIANPENHIKASSKRKPARRFVMLNKNFANYPLARDSRVVMPWLKSQKTGRWLAELPGDDRIQFRLPEDVDESLKRSLTGFDMLVLFEVQRRVAMGGTTVEFKSRAALLRAIGLSKVDSHRNRYHKRLKAALALWSELTVWFGCWYDANVISAKKWKKGQGTIRRTLPPPIQWRAVGRGLRITLDKEWHELASIYFLPVLLPLPTNSTHQNLILWLLTSVTQAKNGGYRFTQAKTRRQLCNIVGLNHKMRNKALDLAIEAATRWYKAHRGKLEIFSDSTDGVVFMIKNAPVPRDKADEEAAELDAIRSLRTEGEPASKPRPLPKPVRAKARRVVAHDEDDNEWVDYEFDDGRVMSEAEYANYMRK